MVLCDLVSTMHRTENELVKLILKKVLSSYKLDDSETFSSSEASYGGLQHHSN